MGVLTDRVAENSNDRIASLYARDLRFSYVDFALCARNGTARTHKIHVNLLSVFLNQLLHYLLLPLFVIYSYHGDIFIKPLDRMCKSMRSYELIKSITDKFVEVFVEKCFIGKTSADIDTKKLPENGSLVHLLIEKWVCVRDWVHSLSEVANFSSRPICFRKSKPLTSLRIHLLWVHKGYCAFICCCE